jgi:TM2 domain-containing membrane protein YozV
LLPLDPIDEEIQSRLRKARVMSQRGDSTGAGAVLESILAEFPNHPEALLLRAKSLEENGKIRDARDLLAEVIKAGMAPISLERKHAELVLKVATRDNIVNAALSDDFTSLLNPDGVKRSPGTAAFFSMLLPGFGQLYNGEVMKGIIFMVAAVLCWIGLLVLGIGSRTVTPWFWPSLIGLGVVYVGSIIDASLKAGSGGRVAKPERPRPPVDKPFE